MIAAFRGVLLVVAVVLAGCGGGGGGSSDGGIINPSPSPLTASFQADQPSPNPGDIAMAKGSASGDVVTVAVTVTAVSNIYGASFEVTFDPAKAGFVNYSKGTLLEAGGQTVNYTVSNPSSGRVVVGVSRIGNVPAASVSTQTPIVNLTFRVKDKGAFALDFGSNAALLDAGNPPAPLGGLRWFGGDLQGF